MNKITTFFSGISQQTFKIDEKNNTEPNSCYMHQQPLVPYHGTQYEQKSIQQSWRNVQGQTSGWTDELDHYLHSLIVL